jgi:beta-glucosidase-like glycosyl hydrolase
VGCDNEAQGTELGRLHLVNNRNVDSSRNHSAESRKYRSNKISTPNRAFPMPSHFFVGYEANWQEPTSPLHQLIQQGVSGVILFRHHTAGLTGWAGFNTLRTQLWTLRRFAHQAGTPHFMIGVDQEGGQVERFGASFFPSFLSPACVAQVTASNPTFAGRHYTLLAKVLHVLGINLNFFPTADVNLDEHNPIIGIRSFGNTAKTVQPLALQAIASHLQAGVLPVVKHFPGHGFGTVDSHHTLPTLTFTTAENSVFQACITEGNAPLAMVSHGYYPGLQGETPFPASLDKRIVTNLLRQTMGFDGLSISDDLEMGAILETATPISVVQKGLEAGLDLLLYRQGSAAMLALVQAAQETIDVDTDRDFAFQQRLNHLQTKHPTCFLAEPPLCTALDYKQWMDEAEALTQEAVSTLLTACGNPKIDPETPLWVIVPNAGNGLPHFAEDETTHPTISSLLVTAGCHRVRTSHYSTPEEEAILADLILSERQANPSLQILIATWLPKVGGKLLNILANKPFPVEHKPSVWHWAIGGSALSLYPSLATSLQELPLFGYRPALKMAVVNTLLRS